MTALSTFCLTTVVCVFFAMLFQRHTATLEIKHTFFFFSSSSSFLLARTAIARSGREI